MPNYEKMYAILCGAIDDIIDKLREIPMARSYAKVLEDALLKTEDLYIETVPEIIVIDKEKRN